MVRHAPRLHIVELDVTDVEASNRTKVDNTVRVWGCVDVLVNNAGTTPKSLLEEGRCVGMLRTALRVADGR